MQGQRRLPRPQGDRGRPRLPDDGAASASAHMPRVMPRQPRFRYPGAVLHVTHRGNNRTATFGEDRDRRRYLAALARSTRLHGVTVHAYALMTNHVHLLVSPATSEGLPRAMRALGRDYVGWHNHRHQRTGTLWEGRYKATLVDNDGYLLACMRYIEQNPVRAGLTAAPAAHRWSSCRANALGAADALVAPHAAYLALADDAARRREIYEGWCAQAPAADELGAICASTQFEWVLGSEAFRRFAEAVTGRRAERAPMGRPSRTPAPAATGKVVSDPTWATASPPPWRTPARRWGCSRRSDRDRARTASRSTRS